jgi:uncharacterized membrane protein YjgN (DUF898 family)
VSFPRKRLPSHLGIIQTLYRLVIQTFLKKVTQGLCDCYLAVFSSWFAAAVGVQGTSSESEPSEQGSAMTER